MGKQTRKPRAPKSADKVKMALDHLSAEAIHKREEVDHHTPAFEIGEHPMEEDAPLFAREIHFFGPSNLDRAVFCRQLATLIEVGIPLLKALQMLSRRTAHAKLAEAISRVARGVEEGQSVSDAMRENEQVFSPLVCNLIKVGEQGGMLETSLIRLAQIMESRADIKRKLVAAMAYPAVALCVAFAVIVLILVKAVPVFTSVYGEAGADLPPLTQVVIGVSNFVTGWFWIWLPLLVVAIAAAIWYGRTPEGKHLYSLLALRVPGLSRVTQKIAVARFSRTLGGLLASGIPLIESVSIAAETNENRVIGDALRSVHSGVEKGEKMTRPLAKADIFPPLVVDMISIGEETGTLDRMLDKIADIYEADVDSALRGLATIIEPLLIVFLGGVVIVIALAVMLPYFHLVEIV